MNRKQPKNLTLNKSGDHVGFRDYEVDSAGETCDHRWQYTVGKDSQLYHECAWCLAEREIDPRDHQDAINFYLNILEQRLDTYARFIAITEIKADKKRYEKAYNDTRQDLKKFLRFLEVDRPPATERQKKSSFPLSVRKPLEGKDKNNHDSTNLNMPQGERSPNNGHSVLGGREGEKEESDRAQPPSTDSEYKYPIPPSTTIKTKDHSTPYKIGTSEKLLGGTEGNGKESDRAQPPSKKLGDSLPVPPSTDGYNKELANPHDTGNIEKLLGGTEGEKEERDRVIPPSKKLGDDHPIPPSKNNNNKEMAKPHDMGTIDKLRLSREQEKKDKDSTIPPSKKTRRKKGEGTGYLAKYNFNRGGQTYEQYNYHWEIWRKGELVARKRKYVPKRLVEKIQKMEAEKVPIKDILFLLL